MAIYINFSGLEKASQDVVSLKAKFEEEMQALEELVNETTINDWKGPDADLFVSNTTAKLTELRTKYNTFLEELTKCINDNYEAFKDTQNRNIQMQG